MVQMLHRHATH